MKPRIETGTRERYGVRPAPCGTCVSSNSRAELKRPAAIKARDKREKVYAYTRRSRIGNTLDAKLDADRVMRVFPCRYRPGGAGVDKYGMRGIYTSAGRGRRWEVRTHDEDRDQEGHRRRWVRSAGHSPSDTTFRSEEGEPQTEHDCLPLSV